MKNTKICNICKLLYWTILCLYVPGAALLTGDMLAADSGLGGTFWMILGIPQFVFLLLGYIELGCFIGRLRDRENRAREEKILGTVTGVMGLFLMLFAGLVLAGFAICAIPMDAIYELQSLLYKGLLISAWHGIRTEVVLSMVLCALWVVGATRFKKRLSLRVLLRPGRRVMVACMAVLFVLGLSFTAFLHTRIEIATHSKTLEEYDEYILYHREYESSGLFDSGRGTKVWFLPGRKQRLLRALREDTVAALETEVRENPDEIASYEIDGDFESITVYYYEDVEYGTIIPRIRQSVSSKVRLYTDLKEGRVIDFVHLEPVPREG